MERTEIPKIKPYQSKRKRTDTQNESPKQKKFDLGDQNISHQEFVSELDRVKERLTHLAAKKHKREKNSSHTKPQKTKPTDSNKLPVEERARLKRICPKFISSRVASGIDVDQAKQSVESCKSRWLSRVQGKPWHQKKKEEKPRAIQNEVVFGSLRWDKFRENHGIEYRKKDHLKYHDAPKITNSQ